MIIQDLWKYYGDDLVFQNITAVIGNTDRIGLVGANGVGKTTLLRTLIGELSPDKGQITKPGGYTLGYLWQAVPSTDKTLESFLEEPFAEQIQLEGMLRTLEQEMGTLEPGSALEEAMGRYARIQDRFEYGGGYDYHVQISSVTMGLGFVEHDLSRALSTFSGGEQMRVSLARLLLARPSLLVLDEPTNHLDIEAIKWLEDFLSSYTSAFIVVSHDRYFLDKVATQIWEIQQHKLYQYKGNYSGYLPQRELRQAQIEESLERQMQERTRMEFFIQKFKAGTRSRQAKNMEKRLERLPEIDRVLDDPSLVFRFESKQQSGNNIVFLERVSKSFGQNQVLRQVKAEVKRGQRIALLGANGSGKSTLLKILGGQLDYQGELSWGTGIDVGYFSQQISFEPGNTVLEELYEEHRFDLGVLRSVLARFLFKGEDVFKQTSVLSGGEKNRLALAKLLLHRPNVLLLDEPTNHLDIFAREALENALLEFGGTIIFVSHDRYFIEKLATKVWALEDGYLTEYVGGFRAYDETRRGLGQKAVEANAKKHRILKEPAKVSGKLEQERALLEGEITRLETRLRELEDALALPELYQDEAKSVLTIQEYHDVNQKINEKYELWERVVDEL